MPLARLYPYSPRQGFVLRQYTLVNQGLKFVGERKWYEVSVEVAEILKKIPQQSRHPAGPKAFMIAENKEEAKKMDSDLLGLLRVPDDVKVGTVDDPVKTPVVRPGKREEGGGPKPRRRSTVAVSEND